MKWILILLSFISCGAYGQILYEANQESNNIITTTNLTTLSSKELRNAKHISIQAVVDVNTPAAKTFAGAADVDPDTDLITEAAHGFVTGLKGQITTAGTEPTGLALLTDYFVIATTSGTYKLAASLSDALAGTPVDITADGVGNSTFTPTALAGGTVTLQKSNTPDCSVWDNVASGTSITADADVWFEIPNATVVSLNYKCLRLSYTLTAGMMSVDNYFYVKGSN